MTLTLDQLPAEDFESLLTQSLAARAGARDLSLTVDGVWRSPYPTGRSIPGFSLFLRGPLEHPLAQGMITLMHPQHGALELFLTPIGRDAKGLRYEVVFN